jgi:hypothetical protein
MRPDPEVSARRHWLNRSVFGIGLASLFSDWSHEIGTTGMTVFLGYSALLFVAGAMLAMRVLPRVHG